MQIPAPFLSQYSRVIAQQSKPSKKDQLAETLLQKMFEFQTDFKRQNNELLLVSDDLINESLKQIVQQYINEKPKGDFDGSDFRNMTLAVHQVLYKKLKEIDTITLQRNIYPILDRLDKIRHRSESVEPELLEKSRELYMSLGTRCLDHNIPILAVDCFAKALAMGQEDAKDALVQTLAKPESHISFELLEASLDPLFDNLLGLSEHDSSLFKDIMKSYPVEDQKRWLSHKILELSDRIYQANQFKSFVLIHSNFAKLELRETMNDEDIYDHYNKLGNCYTYFNKKESALKAYQFAFTHGNCPYYIKFIDTKKSKRAHPRLLESNDPNGLALLKLSIEPNPASVFIYAKKIADGSFEIEYSFQTEEITAHLRKETAEAEAIMRADV